jgi:hypothetical protein
VTRADFTFCFSPPTFPDQTLALALLDCASTLRRQDDYPSGIPAQVLDRITEGFGATWGSAGNLKVWAPEMVDDERFREWFARLERGR